MIQLYSLPLIVCSSISFILSLFFMLLYHRLKSRHEEQVYYYLIFSLSALLSSVFLAAFAILINSSENLDYLNISNRVTIITAMFTIVIGLHFFVAFFEYKAPVLLKLCYAICGVFSLLALVPNQYFLAKEYYATSTYYTGLVFGPLFQLWGIWILLLAGYCIVILTRIYVRQYKKKNNSLGTVQLLLGATSIWMVTGVADTLTGIQVIDLPPLTWVGSFLVTCCNAWILVLHIDDLYEQRRQLNNRLMHDHLTQAFSRSYFEFRLTEAINKMSRNHSIKLHLCIFDIDNFKTINDSYGHINGDELLKAIATIVKENIRPIDCFARLGGDEFVLLLIDLDDQHAYEIVARIKKSIFETTFGLSTLQFSASCSFGMVSSGAENLVSKNLSKQLLSKADEALYIAKNQGKNTIRVLNLSKSEALMT
ncbi:GGDEF domain-containing protein [Shewanella sp. Arc9-LZ]|uniref:GGDEF domain-containing protein n=1 Tax=Shewanella sp. Arc9-LZ TaxID=2698686 RepID=UPI00137BE314|nr:GGDEF domain-containing protein [Shewanella sp. Arc9-LZ]QHS14601.1 diguanylate cyclase [Shewanella sp. Arc9-LZ]